MARSPRRTSPRCANSAARARSTSRIFPASTRPRPTATTCSTSRTSTRERSHFSAATATRSSIATSSTSRRRPTIGRISSTSSSGARCRSSCALKERGGLPLLEWGYPVLIATLVQAVAASVLLILLPLKAVARRADERGDAGGIRRARRRVFPRHRLRLHVRRDRVHPEIPAAAERTRCTRWRSCCARSCCSPGWAAAIRAACGRSDAQPAQSPMTWPVVAIGALSLVYLARPPGDSSGF